MRKAKEIIYSHYGEKSWEDVCKNFLSEVSPIMIEEIVKIAQIDAIEETCKVCAEKSRVEIVDHEELYISSLPGYNRNIDQVILPIYGIDEQSILNCAKLLKKEIE